MKAVSLTISNKIYSPKLKKSIERMLVVPRAAHLVRTRDEICEQTIHQKSIFFVHYSTFSLLTLMTTTDIKEIDWSCFCFFNKLVNYIWELYLRCFEPTYITCLKGGSPVLPMIVVEGLA